MIQGDFGTGDGRLRWVERGIGGDGVEVRGDAWCAGWFWVGGRGRCGLRGCVLLGLLRSGFWYGCCDRDVSWE